MRHQWVNLILLTLVACELVSGAAGLMSGHGSHWIILQAHSVFGYGIVAVLVWKAALALGSLQRPSAGRPRTAALTLAFLLLTALTIGFVWTTGGFWSVEGVTGMSLHIYAGAAITPFIVWHAWSYTSHFRTGFNKGRREALRFGAVAAAGAGIWFATEALKNVSDVPGSRRRFTGSHERRSFEGNRFPTTSWINDDPSRIDPVAWRLRLVDIEGSVETYSLPDLEQRVSNGAFSEMEATLDCTGGWHSTQNWGGVMLKDLLRDSSDVDGARTCIFHSVTGYTRRYSLRDVDELMLATRVGGEPLSHGHGGPMRLVAPGRRGYDWVKWIDEIKLTASPSWFQPWLPLQ